MKRWNELIVLDEAKGLSDGQIERHIGMCVKQLEAEGINHDDAKNMVASLLGLGYVAMDRRVNHWGKLSEEELKDVVKEES
jgi:hypothetical protein